ncbi:conserved hypothetical protein [Methanocaldococcus infernus ME]|uniref:Uncharacterized protein n=1 Tax=Methanocaldococcus infernus (strain DSM 11812 / JCM 15783 / ME) TaxID=573063 RepID=D5VQZ3_METIM|nr:hypothetical protein [Methanocaldococcus infernus]ADG12996.1 conserved hypothetical protein [Methanocaldococcus infernus ME]
MILEKSKVEITEDFIRILEILRRYAKGKDEKAVIKFLINYLEEGKMLEEDIIPISKKIFEVAKKVADHDLRKEIKYILFESSKKLKRSEREKINKIIDILEYLKNYIDKKPFKSEEDYYLLTVINFKIERLASNIVTSIEAEIRDVVMLSLKIGGNELKKEVELLLLGRKRRKVNEKFLETKRLLIETLEMIKEEISKKEYLSSIDYETLFLINLKIFRLEENIIRNINEEFNSLLSLARKVGNYRMREKINMIKESLR